MKQKRFGQKVQNWHRPFDPQNLRNRYLRKLYDDVEYTDDSKLRQSASEMEGSYDDFIRRYEDGWKQEGISLDEYFYRGYYNYEFMCCINCSLGSDGTMEDMDILFEELMGLHRPIDLTPLINFHVQSNAVKEPMYNVEDRIADYINRLNNYRDDFPAFKESLVHAIGNLRNIGVLEQCIQNSKAIKSILYFAPFWLRSPLSWNPESDVSILEHLFCYYKAPAFLHHIKADETFYDYKWLIWLIVLGQGGSLKRAGEIFNWNIPTRFVHHLYSVPETISKERATMFAEIKRLGGSTIEYRRLTQHYAYTKDISEIENYDDASKKDIAFWQSTVQWLIANKNAIADGQVFYILDWAMHRYTESRYGRSAPFSWKGRQLHNILDQSNRYRLERERRYKDVSWKRHDMDWNSENKSGNLWTFTELTSGKELYNEGKSMHHCVASYTNNCVDGSIAIVSVTKDDKPAFTIEITTDNLTVRQARGKFNRSLNGEENTMLSQWRAELSRRLT